MEKVAQGALMELVEAGLIAVDEREFGTASETLGGGGEGVVEDGFLDSPKAEEAPTGSDDFMQERLLGRAGGGKVGHVPILQLAEGGRGFVSGEHGFRGKPVAQGVARRTGFARGRNRSAREFAVGASSLNLA